MTYVADNSDTGTSVGVAWWKPVLFAALAGGMAWGIRGQYGHETGAMIAGLLVSLTLTLLLCPRSASLPVARAVAWTTVAMGFGGSMTYGQTLGLTHNPDMVGNWAALSWGMFGLVIKGGVWIGFAGVFLGMGLGGVRHRPRHLVLLLVAIVAAFILGRYLMNTPFDPANRRLPFLYFSADWRWQPHVEDLRPRPEVWGGLLLALTVTIVYAALRKDGLGWRMGLWGLLGGALGFPLGQSLQAYHGWNREAFQQGIWANLAPHINWWNMMETTFGAIMGAALGLGLWLHRKRIRFPAEAGATYWPAAVGAVLMALHVYLLIGSEFPRVTARLAPALIESDPLRFLLGMYGFGIVMAIIPMIGIAADRWWPYFMALPITLLVIAGKTVLELVYVKDAISAGAGWAVYFWLPMLVATAAAVWFALKARAGQSGQSFARAALLLTTWTYFLLNFAFFRFPWPWEAWTSRTPNAAIFTICAAGLTILVLTHRRDSVDVEP
jgi:hypothetical protein